MLPDINQNYARLLVDYCLSLQPGDRLYLQSTTLAEPLVREIYRAGLQRGANVIYQLDVAEHDRVFYTEARAEQLDFASPLYQAAMQEFETYLYIRAPFNLREDHDLPADKKKRRGEAMQPYVQTYFARTGSGEMRRSLCQYPTAASAQEAGLALSEYQDFVHRACKLDRPDPAAAWRELSRRQQSVVDHLNGCTEFTYRNARTDITFRTRGRRWINSDGQTNMPSGEVYTSPEEDSAEGHVHFDYPAIRGGSEVRGVTLEVKAGEIVSWQAEQGQEVLDEVFDIPGTRRFGEAAIGTNYGIDRFTKNILFDEKIGGTFHMAIGQSYAQAGGKNQSAVHWDMIADMKAGGEILADGRAIYRDGYFTIADLAGKQ